MPNSSLVSDRQRATRRPSFQDFNIFYPERCHGMSWSGQMKLDTFDTCLTRDTCQSVETDSIQSTLWSMYQGSAQATTLDQTPMKMRLSCF